MYQRSAALALAASINDCLNFDNTTFLSDSQLLVHFLNAPDQNHPPDWRAKPYTQMFMNAAQVRQGKVFKFDRSMNTTAHVLARQALATSALTDATFQPVCSYAMHDTQCSLLETLSDIQIQSVRLIAALLLLKCNRLLSKKKTNDFGVSPYSTKKLVSYMVNKDTSICFSKWHTKSMYTLLVKKNCISKTLRSAFFSVHFSVCCSYTKRYFLHESI
jgi:hypothetical protein